MMKPRFLNRLKIFLPSSDNIFLMPTAIFDTHAGYLQWLSREDCQSRAIAEHLKAVSPRMEYVIDLYVVSISGEQAICLEEWSRTGSQALDCPQDLPPGRYYPLVSLNQLLLDSS